MRSQSLRTWRTSQLRSIGALAKASGVSEKTIIEVEHNRHAPRFATMRKLADALGVDPHQVKEFKAAMAIHGTSSRAQISDGDAA